MPSVPYISRDERPDLHAFRYSQYSDNPHCMNLLLDFIETEFGLLPVESPGESNHHPSAFRSARWSRTLGYIRVGLLVWRAERF